MIQRLLRSSRAALLGASLLSLTVGSASASSERDPQAEVMAETPPIDDADPLASVPSQRELNRDPLRAGLLLMELSSRAEAAEKDQKPAQAVKYYAALAKAVPDRALAFGKLCGLYIELLEPGEARSACRRATELEGAQLVDHLRYATVLLGEVPPGAGKAVSLPAADVAELEATFQHLQSQQVTAVEVDYLACKLALKLEDAERLRRCVEALVQKRPGDAVTLSHQYSLALLELDYPRAAAVIEQARQAGLPAEVLKLMEEELAARAPRPALRIIQGLAAAVLIGGGAWAGRSLWRRRRNTAPA